MPDTERALEERYERGKALRVAGDYDAAMSELLAVVEACSEHVAARMELGLCYCYMGLFDESLRELREAVRQAPADAQLLMHFAKTSTMLGEYDEGRAAFQRIVELTSPGDALRTEAEEQLTYL